MSIPPKRRPKHWKVKRGRLVVARTDDDRLRFTVERSFAELSQLPAAADPLGASVQRLPERIRFRRHVAVCAPSDCPRVPDPVGIRRARAVDAAVYEARLVLPSWSTNVLYLLMAEPAYE